MRAKNTKHTELHQEDKTNTV